MDVNIEEISPVKKKVTVEIPVEMVSKEIDSAYEGLKKKAKIKGFRPGKAPRSILERYFKDYVKAEVIQKLIEETYQNAISENNLNPISPPLIDPGELEAGKSFQYTAIIEVKPDFQLEEYLGLKIEASKEPVKDEEIEERLKNLQNMHASIKTVNEQRPVQAGDYVIIDYEAKEGGKTIEGGKAINFSVEIGRGQFIKELEEKLIGMKIDEEKEIEISFPKDYGYKKWANKKISFHVRIKEVKEKILPPIDDEFAMDVGGYSSLEELKARLKEEIEREKELEWKRQLKEKIVDQLIEKNRFEVPESMIERQAKILVSNTKLRLATQGLSLKNLDTTEDELLKEYQDLAERQVRTMLILEKIAEKEGISISEDEIENRFKELSEETNQKLDLIKRYYERNELITDLKKEMLMEKTLNFLFERAEITSN